MPDDVNVLRRELEDLRLRVQAQDREVARLSGLLSIWPPTGVDERTPPGPSAAAVDVVVQDRSPLPPTAPRSTEPGIARRTDRRHLIGGIGVAAATVVSGVVASAVPAAAADGDALEAGSTVTFTSPEPTRVARIGAAGTEPVVVVSDGDVAASGGSSVLVALALEHRDVAVEGRAAESSTDGVGVLGGALSGTGVHGSSLLGTGVRGSTGAGVGGEFQAGVGIGLSVLSGGVGISVQTVSEAAAQLTSTSGSGLEATSNSGVGVRANGTTGGRFGGSSANLQLDPVAGVAPPLRTTASTVGALVFDEAFDLWICVGSGTPGTWRKLTGGGGTGDGLTILASTERVYDSRPGLPANGVKGALANDAERAVDMTTPGGVPLGASAVLVNLTVTQTSAAGFLALFKDGVSWPGTSSINWDHLNQTIANLAVVPLDTNGRLRAKVSSNSSTQFILDVIGYYG